MKKVVHIVSRLLDGGIEQGVSALMKGGFYDASDFSIVELVRGQGSIRSAIVNEIGEDKVTPLIDRREVKIPSTEIMPELILRMHSVFKAQKPDTIVLSHSMATVAARIAAMAHSNIKIVSFEHSVRINATGADALRFTSWRSDAVFGDSLETLRQRECGYFSSKPSYVVPLAILEPSEPRDGHIPETIKVLSLGRLSQEKNFRELIHAAALLLREGHKIDLTIAGEGSERPLLEQTLRELDAAYPSHEISQHIHLPGFVSGALALKKLRDQAHIYVQPSLHEGFCIATAEALAAGLPTAATDFAGVRDYGNEQNIRRINGTSRAGIGETLRDMVVNYGDIVEPMSKASIETAKQRFSCEAVKGQWMPAIEEILSPRLKRSWIAFQQTQRASPR